MPRWAQGNLWHLTFLAQNTAVFHCCLIPDPSPLESHNSSICHYIPRSGRALWAQQSLVNTWVDIIPSISCTDRKGKPAAVQMLFLSLYSTHAWRLARLISVHFYSLTLATSGIGSPWGNIPGIQTEIFFKNMDVMCGPASMMSGDAMMVWTPSMVLTLGVHGWVLSCIIHASPPHG